MRDTGKRVSLLFSPGDNLGKRTLLLSRINIAECVDVMATCITRAIEYLENESGAVRAFLPGDGLTRGKVVDTDRRSLWGGSSVGRALRSQCRGREFDSPPLHFFPVLRRGFCSAGKLCPPPTDSPRSKIVQSRGSKAIHCTRNPWTKRRKLKSLTSAPGETLRTG